MKTAIYLIALSALVLGGCYVHWIAWSHVHPGVDFLWWFLSLL